MWQARKVTKPEYIKLCNWIHLLDLQVNKESMARENTKQVKHTLMAKSIGSKAKARAYDIPMQRTGTNSRWR